MREPQQAFFDERAAGWEERSYPPETLARLAELVGDLALPRGAAVLDLGAGTAVLHPYLRAALGPAGTIVALDLSHAMLRVAQSKPLGSRDLLVQATALGLPFPDRFFDVVLCFAAFPHFPDPHRALAEMARVARPGGEVVVAHLLSREELSAHHGRYQAVQNDLLPDESSMRGLFESAGLGMPEIVDRPGRYLARGRRQALGPAAAAGATP